MAAQDLATWLDAESLAAANAAASRNEMLCNRMRTCTRVYLNALEVALACNTLGIVGPKLEAAKDALKDATLDLAEAVSATFALTHPETNGENNGH